MTTTAATISASPSTSNDSPIQDNNGATESIESHQQQSSKQQQQQQLHQANNTEQKRPMNAFLLFCKEQRPVVREKHPNLENRGITRILGDLWSTLDKKKKDKFTDRARQDKEAFMKANPDFKWYKTPMSNNNNNSNSSTTNSNSNIRNDCYPTRESIPSAHLDTFLHQSQTNSRDILASRQHAAPKPPKKRFLERNDSIYTTKDNSTNDPTNEDPPTHVDGVVPYISLDQDFVDRVIDEAFSESNSSPLGTNKCKSSNRISTNLTSSIGVNPTFSNSISTSYSTNADEPVDFSMNTKINTTSQKIINNVIEKILLGSADNSSSSTSKMSGTDSVQSQTSSMMKRESPEDT